MSGTIIARDVFKAASHASTSATAAPPASMAATRTIGIIAGNGVYPETFVAAARRHSPGTRLVVTAFENETKPELAEKVDAIGWFRVGQLSKLINSFKGVSSRRLFREFPWLENRLWKGHLWSPSYFIVAVGGAPLDIIKRYVETQRER